jgi:hypothetical protein
MKIRGQNELTERKENERSEGNAGMTIQQIEKVTREQRE